MKSLIKAVSESIKWKLVIPYTLLSCVSVGFISLVVFTVTGNLVQDSSKRDTAQLAEAIAAQLDLSA